MCCATGSRNSRSCGPLKDAATAAITNIMKSSWYGDCLPERDFPTLIDLYRQGRLPLEKFVSERIGLDGIEDAFHKMHAGEVLRSVVVL